MNGNFSGTCTEWLLVHCFQVQLEIGNVPWNVGTKTNQTQDTLVGGECSHHCAIPAPSGMFITKLRHKIIIKNDVNGLGKVPEIIE